MTSERESLLTDGPVLRPGDPDYDRERAGFNLIVDHQPALIVGATGAADVIAAVNHARERDLPVAIQATGHGVTIPADGALLINTSRMDGVRVDPAARTARIEAGVRSRRLVHEASAFGLAPLNGSAPSVGVVSFVLGGGVPLLGRRFGFAADHVREIDVVTADGQLRTVSPAREPDLFWALRGGKGNFGVVVSMELDLMPVARLYGGGLWFGAAHIPSALQAWAAWTAGVPDEMGSSVLLIRMPELPMIPEALRGRHLLHIRIAHSGDPAQGEALVRPLRQLAPTVMDTVRVMPYRDVGTIHDEPTVPVPFHGQHSMLAGLNAPAVEALLAAAGPDAPPVPYFIEIRHFGGALSRPAKLPSPGRRDAAFSVYTGSIVPVGPGEYEKARAQHQLLHRAVRPFATGGGCANFLGGPHVTTADLRAAFLPEDFDRLVALKRRYDPGDLFRINLRLK